MKIAKSGFFAPHPEFEMFGIIHYSDGTTSDLLVTKRHALETGEVFVGISITEEEWGIIRKQIHDSGLLDKNKELEEFAQQTQIAFTELKNKVGTILRAQEKDNWWKDKE